MIEIKDILISKKDERKIALIEGDKSITYRDLHLRADKNRGKLISVANNDQTIGIFLPNSIDYAIAYFSIAYLDKTIVPIETGLKHFHLNNIIEYCDIKLIITNKRYGKVLYELLAGRKDRLSIFCVDSGEIEWEIGNVDNQVYINDTELENVAILLHTSGTSSFPKRVMLTHKNLISNIESNIASLKLTSSDISLITLPMFFGYCNTSQFLTHLFLGATSVIMEQPFYPERFLRTIERYSCTNTTCVPSMLMLLMNVPSLKYDVTNLRYICFGGGNISTIKLKYLIQKFPTIGFIQTYGQTEASPRITALMPEDSIKKLGSVGKPIPGVEVEVISKSGNELKENELGQIIVKGNNVFKGYFRRKELTAETIQKGWLYTGDLGKFDKDGYLYIVGRLKNVIISGGLNIYPEEVEEILRNHPFIENALVKKEENELLGEIPVADIVLNSQNKLTETDILTYCLENLENYQIPKKINIVNTLPKTYNNKIKRASY
ncbi:Long-chain-fatty-acid--CoA ligase [Lactococcus lactis subsp. lactis]|uniref:class I adenylate-forming enzyme family protein n=1 Tax=Lactococcus lactis TaxID=1358 RepID=UPI00071D0889|nr:class I adenylate-forming enzyme family protein [Lactococcus lactis]KST91466.1 Long-chain-fatty-acid--CoA ligase [Lactococcus lactis subsp. lactis]